MQMRIKGGVLAAAVLGACAVIGGVGGCQEKVPFPMEPLRTAGARPAAAVPQTVPKAEETTFGFPKNVPLPVNPGVPVAQDIVGELQSKGVEEVVTVNWEAAPEEFAQEEAPPKLGPGEYRYVFTPGPVSYRALEDLAYAQAYAQATSTPPVVIQQNFYEAAPAVTYGYGGYIAPVYGGYRPYAPVYGAPFYPRSISAYGGVIVNRGGGFNRFPGGGFVPVRPMGMTPRFVPRFSPMPMGPGTVVPMGVPPVPMMPPGTVVVPR